MHTFVNMYYRRKYLLALLEEFDGTLSKISFQKLLFLATRVQRHKKYNFIPSSFGCYSITANQDLTTLTKYGEVEVRKIGDQFFWSKGSATPYCNSINDDDQFSIRSIANTFSSYSQQDLVKYTYVNYPWFAINSTIASKILSDEENEKIVSQRRTYKNKALLSIGYEGESLESFLNKLIINDVKTLIDVRKNALSMKFGFSKSQISDACKQVHIKYAHLPELGIVSTKRQDLKTYNDYKVLLDDYETNTLPEALGSLQQIKHEIETEKRISLMCFEKDASYCHRSRIINVLSKSLPQNIHIHNLK